MLLKINSIALVLAVTSISAFAEQAPQPVQPPQPNPVPAVQEAPKKGVPVRGNNLSIPMGDITKYVRGFYVKTEGACNEQKLKVQGLVHPKCLKHLRIELDDPATDNTGSWAIRLEKANFRDSITGKDIELADEACKPELTKQCVALQPGVPASEDDCVDISKLQGFKGLEQSLTSDGDVGYRVNNADNAAKPYDVVAFNESLGNVEKIESCKVQEARAKKEKFDAEWNEMIQMCNDALEQGDLDRYAEFRSNLDKLVTKKEGKALSGILKRLDADMSEKSVEALKARIAKIKTAEDVDAVMVAIDDFLKKLKGVDADAAAKFELPLKVGAINKGIEAQPGLAGYGELIEIINRFGRDSEHRDARRKAVELLLIVARDANEQGGFSDEEFQAKSMIVERALAAATKLDPKNGELKKGLYAAKMERFKATAASGNSKYYNAKTRKEMARTVQEMGKFAASSKDGEAHKMYSKFAQDVTPNQVIPIDRMDFHPMTGQPIQSRYYTMGNKLDSDFYKAQNQANTLSLDDQFQVYKQNFMVGADGLGGTYQTAAPTGGTTSSSSW